MLEVLYDNLKIAALADEKKLSGNELGRLAGISGPSMHAILSGKTKIVRYKTLQGIAAALGVPIQQLIKVKGGKVGSADLYLEAMTSFSQLNPDNQAAMLATMRHLVAQQKKK